MERYLTVSIDRHARGRTTSASSSVLSTLTQPPEPGDDDMTRLPLTRSRHSVDCSGLITSPSQRPSSSASRSTSRLHLGVPSDLRRSSLQADHPHQRQRQPCPHQHSRTDSACDGGGGGCAQSSGSRSSVALTDDEAASTRRVSYGGAGAGPLRAVSTISATRETTIFDIGADLIKVRTTSAVERNCLMRASWEQDNYNGN